jgi:hypothetical protein
MSALHFFSFAGRWQIFFCVALIKRKKLEAIIDIMSGEMPFA